MRWLYMAALAGWLVAATSVGAIDPAPGRHGGGGVPGTPDTQPTYRYAHSDLPLVAYGDLNGDGIPDRLRVGPSNARGMHTGVIFSFGRGDGTFTDPVPLATPLSVYGVRIVDADSDGKPDIVALSGGGAAFFLHSNGDGTFAGGFSIYHPPPTPSRH